MADLPDFAEALERAKQALVPYYGSPSPTAHVLAHDVVALHAAWEAATAERDDLERIAFEGNEREKRLEGHVTALREALRLIRDGRCECGGRFKWTDAAQMRCEQCQAHEGYGEPRSRQIAREALAGLDEPPEQVIENRCEHVWRYLPTMDSNPPLEARECVRCGVVEERMGLGYSSDGSPVEPTPWIARDDRSA